MRVASYRRYGGPEVVEIVERPTPEPAPGEILVRVAAASVGASDSAGRLGKPRFARLFFGPFRPHNEVLGSDYVGEIVALGEGVTTFAVGARVYGATTTALGGHAEYVVVPADGAVTTLAAAVSDEQAVALTDGAFTALPFLRDAGRLRAGQRVLVNGASGAVGAAGVQLAKHLGAHVTAVTSTPNAELVRGLGADEVIDYLVNDFTRSEQRWDIVFDAVGKSSFGRARRVLTPSGIYLTTVPGFVMVQSLFTKRAAIAFAGLRKPADVLPDLVELATLAAAGSITPLVDGSYPLERIREAHARVDSGHKRGTVVVRPND